MKKSILLSSSIMAGIFLISGSVFAMDSTPGTGGFSNVGNEMRSSYNHSSAFHNSDIRQQELLRESFDSIPKNTLAHNNNALKWNRQTTCAETLAQKGKILGIISSETQPQGAYVAQLANKKVALVYKNNKNADLKVSDMIAVPAQNCDM